MHATLMVLRILQRQIQVIRSIDGMHRYYYIESLCLLLTILIQPFFSRLDAFIGRKLTVVLLIAGHGSCRLPER